MKFVKFGNVQEAITMNTLQLAAKLKPGPHKH